MQTVNCEVALGGDRRNTVQKYGVTIAELAVLQALHGQDGVFEIEPAGDVSLPHRAERERLRGLYPARDEDGNYVVETVYPGAAARLPERLDDLGLPPDLFTRAYQNALESGVVQPADRSADVPADDVAEEDDLPEIEAEAEAEDDAPEPDEAAVALPRRRGRRPSVME